MSLLAKDKGNDFEPIPVGMHRAVCYGVVDLGTQPSNNPKFKPARKVLFIWELPEERGMFDREVGGQNQKVELPRAISQRFTNSLNKKSNLRPMLEGWRSRPFTEAELEGFELESVAGANCFINVIHEQKEGRTYANVSSITPLPRGTPKLEPENPILKFSLDDTKGRVIFPPQMPEWVKGVIMQSDEFIRREQGAGAPERAPDARTTEGAEEDVPF